MNVLAMLALAVVTQNQVPLRAAPRESASQQELLWKGEVLELRGERGDYRMVYDHRRERAGYVLSSQIHETSLAPEDAPALLTVVRFLRETPREESLGITYAAAYLKAAPASALDSEPFDAIGTMAERLARRASGSQSKASEAATTEQLQIVAQQGIVMNTFERSGGMQICYDGEMFRRVLAMPAASPNQRARAALALTRHDCVDPNLDPLARINLDQWRAEVLERATTAELTPLLANRVHLRRAGVYAAIAFWQSRQGLNPQVAANRSLDELGAVVKSELQDSDNDEYADAAIRVGASRMAAEPSLGRAGKLQVRTAQGAPGETCVSLYDAQSKATAPLVSRCTFGIVWTSSAHSNAAGTAMVLAVQPLAAWRELWVFQREANGWRVDVLPPGADGPGVGYIEFAGWAPAATHMLVVRELISQGHFHRRFEIVRLATLVAEQQAGTPELLPRFGRWQDPVWRSTTIAFR
jgi:hypothetical protein